MGFECDAGAETPKVGTEPTVRERIRVPLRPAAHRRGLAHAGQADQEHQLRGPGPRRGECFIERREKPFPVDEHRRRSGQFPRYRHGRPGGLVHGSGIDALTAVHVPADLDQVLASAGRDVRRSDPAPATVSATARTRSHIRLLGLDHPAVHSVSGI